MLTLRVTRECGLGTDPCSTFTLDKGECTNQKVAFFLLDCESEVLAKVYGDMSLFEMTFNAWHKGSGISLSGGFFPFIGFPDDCTTSSVADSYFRFAIQHGKVNR